jgi:hypothetical protein
LFGPELVELQQHKSVEMGLNGSFEKDVGEIIGTGLYV